MIEKKFQRKTSSWWEGRTVVATSELGNAWMVIPSGTYCVVKRKYKGLSLETDPCPECGVRLKISEVPYSNLDLVQEFP